MKNFSGVEGFRSRIVFCWYFGRDAIRKKCDRSWKFNFDLNGGNNETKNTIRLFNYFYNQGNIKSSNLFLDEKEINNSIFEKIDQLPDIFLPGQIYNCKLLIKTENCFGM